ncbi:MAG: Stp1/IreP family PP2C-type Ser/Thr phosphatase [Ruminococcus sp.]|uniref:Stp1/IreP family PP2C-type Ser/Thr phosphatase n=1 Tax=Ruminococcus sp. TaxID=41978 RepID=UPI002872B384|nr:Stp1/IreP family PP2C-type Ser/Thr phosphatase [Ruminococcus sp.]MBQ3285950.1 Stp1/IreP family PP2C-type Ser/Thr phosphatase [Ruminococcus sp.]
MEVFSKTDIGLVRNENQDSSAYSVISSDCAWAVICDGMGGAHGGKTASSSAVKYISEYIGREYKDDMDNEALCEMLIAAVDGANLTVYKLAMEDYELAGMGTTCDLVFVRSEIAHVVHVGDSRTYSIRNGKILQITEDHSLVQEMVRRGELTPDQAMKHPNKNLITRALGISHEVHIDYIEAEFSEGDRLLICSDGLSNYVSKADMVRTVEENDGDIIIDTLIEIAKRHGGHDNITVTVIY